MVDDLPGRGVHDSDLTRILRGAVDRGSPGGSPRPEQQACAVARPHRAAHDPGRVRAAVQTRVPVRGQRDPLTTSRVRASRTVVARPEVTATHRPSGLTATEAPKDASSTVSPTSTWSTTSPVRGSMKVAATPSVSGPKYGMACRGGQRPRRRDHQPARLDDRRYVRHPAARNARVRGAEAAIGRDVPGDERVVARTSSPGGRPRVDLGAPRRRRCGPSRDSPATSDRWPGRRPTARPRRLARPWPPRTRPARERRPGRAAVRRRAPARRHRPGRRASPCRRPRAWRRRKGVPGIRSRRRPARGSATGAWLPVARSTKVGPARVVALQRIADDASSAMSALSSPPRPASVPVMPVSRGAPPAGSIWTRRQVEPPPARPTSRRTRPAGGRPR